MDTVSFVPQYLIGIIVRLPKILEDNKRKSGRKDYKMSLRKFYNEPRMFCIEHGGWPQQKWKLQGIYKTIIKRKKNRKSTA